MDIEPGTTSIIPGTLPKYFILENSSTKWPQNSQVWPNIDKKSETQNS